MLAGLIYDENGNRLSPSHAVKNGKRYRYYVSRGLITDAGAEDGAEGFRIPAHEIETLVTHRLERLLLGKTQLFDLLKLERYPPTRTRHVLSRARRIGDSLRRRNGRDGTFVTTAFPLREKRELTLFRLDEDVYLPK